jgi:hypothetical protein
MAGAHCLVLVLGCPGAERTVFEGLVGYRLGKGANTGSESQDGALWEIVPDGPDLSGSCPAHGLAHNFSLASVTAWLGNSPNVAATNDLMVTDADFDAATGSALQWGPELHRTVPGNAKTPDFSGVSHQQVAGAGFEPTTSRL